MVANGINGKRDHHETFLISHTNTLFNEQIKVKLQCVLHQDFSIEELRGKHTQATDLRFYSILLNLHGM